MGDKQYGIDPVRIQQYAREVKTAIDSGAEVAIVIGGGNIFRGLQAADNGIERAQGDYMGMLATVINGMALQSALEGQGLYTRLMSAIKMEQICEPYIRRRAIRHLEKGRIVIFGAGAGLPYFSTDTVAAQRALEIHAEEVLVAKNGVDGVYSADPHKDPKAIKFSRVSYAFTLCKENSLPIVVFDMNKPGNLQRILQGEAIGTLVSN